jgi:hypothetical protein
MESQFGTDIDGNFADILYNFECTLYSGSLTNPLITGFLDMSATRSGDSLKKKI